MKLLAAGCSLIYGSELSDERPVQDGYSNLTFPALLAQDLNLEYLCCARPGYGNDAIVRQVVTNFDSNVDLVIVNWSYFNRFEFYFNGIGWKNIRLQPWEDSASNTVKRIADYRQSFYSELTDEYSIYHYLKDIVFLQEFLKNRNVSYVFSSAWEDLLDAEFFANIGADQKKLYSLIDFDKWFFWPNNYSFIKWTGENNYPLGPSLHPLEQAHRDTFELYKKFMVQNSLYKGKL